MRTRLLIPLFLFFTFLKFVNAQGNYWTELIHGLPGELTTPYLTEANGWLYTYSKPDRLYRSVDDGETWQQIYESANHSVDLNSFTFSSNGVLYAETSEGAVGRDIYRSTDGGATWKLHAAETQYRNWIESNNGYVFARKWSGSGTSEPPGIYRSESGTNDWELILETQVSGTFELDKFGHLQIGTLVTRDDGSTWERVVYDSTYYHFFATTFISPEKYIQVMSVQDTSASLVWHELGIGTVGDTSLSIITVDPSTPMTSTLYSSPFLLNDNRIMIIANNKLYMSSDEGQSWTFISDQYNFSGLLDNSPVVLPGSNKILGKVDGDLHVSSDEGLTWTPSYEGHNEAFGFDFSITHDPKTIWANSSNGLFKSPLNGISWKKVSVSINPAQELKITNYAVEEDGVLFAIANYQFYVSSDYGENFTHVASPDSLQFYSPILIKGFDSLFVNSNSGLLRFDVQNSIFEQMNTTDVCREIIRFSNGDLYGIFRDTATAQLRKSIDNGLNWSFVDSPLELSTSPSVYMGNVFKLDHDEVIFLGDGENVYRSEDAGNSWEMVFSATGGSTLIDANLNPDGDLFIATTTGINSEVFRSNNKGDNWTRIPWIENPYHESFGPFLTYDHHLTFDNQGYMYTRVLHWPIQHGIFRTTNPTTDGAYLFGNASKSDDNDCLTFDPEFPMENILVKAEGTNTWLTSTDTLAGDYEMFLDTGMYQVTVIPPLPFFWEDCTTTAHLPVKGDTTWVDFSIPSQGDCPFITVDLAAPYLERCFEQNIYIQYCNHGTLPADSVVLFLEIDSFLTLTDTVLNWQPVPGSINSYSLTLPALEVNECQTIATPVLVSCAAAFGQIHCLTVNGWPDLLCLTPPGWSGAQIEASAVCQDSTIVLALENVGTAASQPLDFVIVEDDVVLLEGEEEYDIAEVASFSYPSEGKYFRIQSDQEPGHPFPGPVAAWEIGCNGDGTPSIQFIQEFPQGDAFGSEDSNCANNAGSFDPNDKQGSPLGYGPNRLIEPGNDIEYLIRFQNTGTAPAHNVVIRDTLSPFIDPGSLRVGAASHSFTWNFEGEDILIFRFENIDLIDSFTNESASHGFISFKIAHRPEAPLGTVINNSAAIYFDFNEPIITNTTEHQLGKDFLEVISSDEEQVIYHRNGITVFPNPASEQVTVHLPPTSYRMEIFDALGHLINSVQTGNKTTTVIRRNNLPDGFYLARVTDIEGRELGRTKIVFK
ncbi:MAG: T9SS type A sorting domain-containing protein [Bacteroidota bacterium]